MKRRAALRHPHCLLDGVAIASALSLHFAMSPQVSMKKIRVSTKLAAPRKHLASIAMDTKVRLKLSWNFKSMKKMLPMVM